MDINITVQKLPEEISDEENEYEALAISDTGHAIGAIGKNRGDAMRQLHKKLKAIRRMALLAIPLLELKLGMHTYSFKIGK